MSEWNPLELAKKSETFCILPWIHQYVGPPGDINHVVYMTIKVS